ncbi:MAG: ParB/RepB/Spo0J family partition protein [Parcubacteria bacterium C7867-001]|nr:MAG: ParB/RepB/Spo0J family partition protein [Parcubacteria bacterium C7867-001]
MNKENLKIEYVAIDQLNVNTQNPRKWSEEQKKQLKESIKRFGNVDPIIVNTHEERKNIVVGGHFRLEACKELGYKNMPVVFVNLTPKKEEELNLRLNRNQGEFNLEMLAKFDSAMLLDIGFDSEDIDEIFPSVKHDQEFNLQDELDKLDITVEAKKGEVYDLDGSRLMIGDSTIEADMLKLMGDNRADMVLTDPPYILDYLKGKGRGKDGATVGFGSKKNRRYLETDILPDNFSELWMANVAKVQKPDFSIIIFENPKNLRTIWNALEAHWKYRNTITWHVPNRMQGFSAANKFFNKTDIALVGAKGDVALNLEPEEEPFQNEYENAIFATSGKAHFEPYEKGKKICPTDFISHPAADKKSSGQEIIFGTKPIELLVPYLKVLTKRNDLILEPFGGSGSTLIAAVKMGRRCFVMEKSHVYAEVIMNRWEKETGKKRKKVVTV